MRLVVGYSVWIATWGEGSLDYGSSHTNEELHSAVALSCT